MASTFQLNFAKATQFSKMKLEVYVGSMGPGVQWDLVNWE